MNGTNAVGTTTDTQATMNPPELNIELTGQRIGGWFITRYIAALIGLWTAVITPASVTIAIRVGQLDPDGKVRSLALVASAGAIAALLANPFFGALSDRFVSRLGQRRPFIIGGFLAGSVATLGIGFAPSVTLVVVGWVAAQLGFNAAIASMISVLPERIPQRLRGLVSGFMGMSSQVGVVGGTFLIQYLGTRGVGMFAAPALIGIVLALPFVLTLREAAKTRDEVGPLSWRVLFGALLVNPFINHDFAFAWLGRFLTWTGLYLLVTYKTYFLIDRLGYTTENVAPVLFRAMLILATCIMVSSISAGWLSDRLKMRKPFVFSASLLFAVGMVVVAFANTTGHFLLGIAISGLAQGMYLGVDYALAAEVLPDQKNEAGKGMGVFNLSNTIPQTLAPAIAPALLALSSAGGESNYTALYLIAAGFAIAGAIAIRFVRGVN